MAFGPEDVTKAVQEALALDTSIPAGHRGAFVTVVNQDGVRVVAAMRMTDDPDAWVLAPYIDHPWAGGLDYGVTIQKTW